LYPPPRLSDGGVRGDGTCCSNRWKAAGVGLRIAAAPGQATGLTTTSLDGLVLDAVRDRDSDTVGGGACICCGGGACICCCGDGAAAPPHAGADTSVPDCGQPALHVSWCSMKLSTLHHI
jgi:hypothetical protein